MNRDKSEGEVTGSDRFVLNPGKPRQEISAAGVSAGRAGPGQEGKARKCTAASCLSGASGAGHSHQLTSRQS